jgi:hypothetical protein
MHGRRRILEAGAGLAAGPLLAALLASAHGSRIAIEVQRRPLHSGNATAMKLICVEEHVLDPGIGAATQDLLRIEAPYMPNCGSRVVDGRHVADPSRPHVVAPGESARKALETGHCHLSFRHLVTSLRPFAGSATSSPLASTRRAPLVRRL